MTRKTRISLLIFLIIVAIGAILLYNHLSTRSPQAPPAQTATGSGTSGGGRTGRVIPVTVYVAKFLQLDRGIGGKGTLLPNEEVNISSEIAGKVERIAFDEGTFVKRGAILVKINDDDLQAQLTRSLFQRDLLRDKLERNRILLDKDAISREAFDQIETDYNMIQADIQLLKVRIDKTEIKAPFDGMIGFRYIGLGSYVQPGTLVARFVDNSKLKVQFAINEKNISKIRNGDWVSFTTEEDRTVNRARIYAIDPTVDEQTLSVTMRAMYENTKMRLKPGMYAWVTAGEKSGNTLQVPTEAIVPDAASMKVWVVRGGKVVSTPVTTGIRSQNMIEITAGLMPGDSVIITGLLQVREGAQVLVSN